MLENNMVILHVLLYPLSTNSVDENDYIGKTVCNTCNSEVVYS